METDTPPTQLPVGRQRWKGGEEKIFTTEDTESTEEEGAFGLI